MSSLPSDLPKLPKWPFLAFDVLLLATAALVAWQSDVPLSGAALLAVVGCVALAAIVCVIPFLTDYARSQELALDERQRALEALSRTVAASAEQLGIAAQGVGILGDQMHKALKQADQIPQKLDEKIGELKQCIAIEKDEEIDALQSELASLRAAECERLEAASAKVSRAIADLAKAEGLIAQLQVQAKEQGLRIAQESELAAARISKAAKEASEDASLRIDHQLGSAQSSIANTLTAGREALDEDLDRRHQELQALIQGVGEGVGSKFSALSTQFEQMLQQANLIAEEARRLATPVPVVIHAPEQPVIAVQPKSEAVLAPVPSEEAKPEVAQVKELGSDDVVDAAHAPSSPEHSEETGLVETTPSLEASSLDLESAPAAPVEPLPPEPVEDVKAKPSQKKTGKKSASEKEALPLDLFSTDYSFEEAMLSHEQSPVSSSLSSDGATRLVVTSYIGIGNKLFLRGDAPGLSLEQGQPLEFVSIGKWRWQSNDLVSPVKVRLFKNDRIECPGLGAIVVEPGHQTEVTAKF